MEVMEKKMFLKFRKSAVIALTSVIALSTVFSASGQATNRNLSSNFTLVNLASGANTGQIQYVLPTGGQWRAAENFTMAALGDQIIRRQYDDTDLPAGSGSVVVSTDGPVGAVVQIQARGQTPTSGAYVGVSEGAAQANVPLVTRKGNSASGVTNSQIIIQNASSIQIDIEVQLISGTDGSVVFTKSFPDVNPNASVEYDLSTELPANVPDAFFGSATVRSVTAGGEVAVVSNFFTGADGMQTFNAFTSVGRQWYAPLFTSRLANGLSAPITVQNVSGGVIPAGSITLSCKKDPSAPGPDTINTSNAAAINNAASAFFNPVTDNTTFPDGWFGSCVVNTGTFDTAMFVQLRFVNGSRAGAYEGILGTGSNQRVVVPLYAKRLGNGFASAVTIQNLNQGAAATVNLEYKGATGTGASCTQTFSNVNIPAGGSLIQNHRIADGANSVPQIADGCFGTLTVTSSNQPIDAFVQLDFLNDGGDAFMAHNAFTVATTN
jgi:hypothetical protein